MRKPCYVRYLEIPSNIVREVNNILKRKNPHPDYGIGDVAETFTVTFNQIPNKKFEADIKVCNADSPYIDPVLFEVIDGIGYEVCVGEVTDTLLGDYYFSITNGDFLVKVVETKKQEA